MEKWREETKFETQRRRNRNKERQCDLFTNIPKEKEKLKDRHRKRQN